MSFRFTILNNRTSVATVIDEMVGWDKNKVKISRDVEWHGIFFSRQGGDFSFYDNGEQVLKAEYDAYGCQGDMTLIIEEDCGQGYELFDQGKFVFLKYYHSTGQDCFVKIPVEQMDDVMDIRNRFDQKVDLQSLVAFDEITALTPYSKLSFPVLLPSKGIFIQDDFENDTAFTTPVQGVPFNDNPGGFANSEMGMIEIGFDNQKSAEIGNAGTQLQSVYDCVLTGAGSFGCDAFDRFTMSGTLGAEICPLQISPFVNFQEGTRNYDAIDNPCQLDILSHGNIEVLKGNINEVWFVVAILPKNKLGNADADYIYLSKQMIYEAFGPGLPAGSTLSLNASYTNNNFNLQKGDRLYCFYTVYHFRTNADQDGSPGWNMTFDAGNFFRLTDISHTPATMANEFMINEAISRTVEVITNDHVRAYSEYFGRTDSQPYAHGSDGCGSLEAITDGLRIRRQENKIPGTTTPLAISLKGLFQGLNPIHNIGMGVEADPGRPGFNRLRVENWKHFYNTDIILECRNIKEIHRATFEKEIYSIFKFGFQKWEAEQYNGLDEFLTKREYRTMLKEVNNTLTQYSTFVGSGYALEITRRLGNSSSSDWRYDKDVFINCLTRTRKFHVFFDAAANKMTFDTDTDGSEFVGPATITVSGSASNDGTRTIFVTSILTVPGQPVQVEIGFTGGVTVDEESYNVTFDIVSPAGLFIELGNVTGPVNIIDPNTLYNYRISPVRNAMRWMNKVLESYRVFDPAAKIVFTDGDGNYFAEGEMESMICHLENAAIAENVTISVSIFADPTKAKPFLLPERVTYEYPMSSCDYKAVKANPGGMIYFENECEQGFGYIDDIIFSPDEQKANFNLIPAITEIEFPHLSPAG